MAPATKDPDSLENGLKDLNLTHEELNKFEKAFKDPEFLKLFEEYAREVSDPKVKAETDQYLRQLEEQGRTEDVYGKGVQLLTPKPGLVLKTKVMAAKEAAAAQGSRATADDTADGSGGKNYALPVGQKVFINVCTTVKVERYSLTEAQDAEGRSGRHLSIPITTGPMRPGTDKHGQPATVIDVVVHPDTIDFAARSTAVMSTLAEMALEQVEKVTRCRLFRGWRRLNARYKATDGASDPPAMCVRTGEGGEAVGGRLRPRADVPGVDVPGAKPPPAAPAGGGAGGGGDGSAAKAAASRSTFSFDRKSNGAQQQQQQQQREEEVEDPARAGFRHPDGAVTPEWALVHRGKADLAVAWGDAGRGLALEASVPQELVVRVTLPEAASAAGVDLDVGERRLVLKVPGKYLLDVSLPYNVDESKGKAKFDKARKQLEITLPVIPPPPPRPTAAAAPVQELRAAANHGGAEGESAARDAVGTAKDAVVAEVGPTAEVPGGSGESAAVAATAQAPSTATINNGEEPGDASAAPAAASSAAAADADAIVPQPSTATVGQQHHQTENERKWRELHACKATEEAEAAVGGAQSDGGDSGGTAAAPGCATGTEDGGALAPSSPSLQTSNGTGFTTVAAELRTAVAAPPPLPEPTVMLQPRLRRDIVMELD